MQFNGFEIKEEIVKALKDLKFEYLTDIQKKVLCTKTKNVIAQSKTGSGKTHAFLIPIFNNLSNDMDVQAVILAPTKELSRQIYRNAVHMSSFFEKKVDIRLYQGGEDLKSEVERLKQQPQIIIGTPGRMKDLIANKKILFVHKAKFLIVDEADMSFDSGFASDILAIKAMMIEPKIMVFSATIQEEVKKTLFNVIDNLEIVKIKDEKILIEHTLIPIKSKDKYDVFVSLTKCINPYLALVFLNTKERANELYQTILKERLNVCLLHGGLEQRERKRIMKEIHDLKYQYIICSDIAARGIDIVGVTHVINYDLPSDYEFYIHRTGRTGRAQLDGIAISLYDFDNAQYLKSIEAKGVKFIYKEIKNGELVEIKKREHTYQKKVKKTPRYKRK